MLQIIEEKKSKIAELSFQKIKLIETKNELPSKIKSAKESSARNTKKVKVQSDVVAQYEKELKEAIAKRTAADKAKDQARKSGKLSGEFEIEDQIQRLTKEVENLVAEFNR
jgi:hypothetical protein